MNKILLYTYTDGTPLETILTINQFDVDVVLSTHNIKAALDKNFYDMCIIHSAKPDNIFDLVNAVRSSNAKIYILAVCDVQVKHEMSDTPYYNSITINTIISNIIDNGADDYFYFPYNLHYVLSIIKARLRRILHSNAPKYTYTVGNYTLNTELKTLTHADGTVYKLTYKEASIIQFLCHYEGTIAPRQLILKSVWHDDNYYNSRSLDVFMVKIRKYFEKDNSVYILNERGRGYSLIVNSDV